MSSPAAHTGPGDEPPEGQTSGGSLWLLPDEACRIRHGARIAALAETLGTPRFEPHVTLLGGVAAAPAELEEAAREIAGETPSLALRFVGVGHLEHYFRAFFLAVEKSPELLAAHARAAARLGRAPDPDYLPHLSLVYGRLDAAAKAALTAELETAHPPCRATRLDAVVTEGPPEEWRRLASFELR